MKILYLCNRMYHRQKLSRGRFDTMAAIAQRATVKFSGVGFDDWDEASPAQQNIDRIMPRADLVVWYKPLEMNDPRGVRIPTCLRYNEMWDEGWTWREIAASGTRLVVCHHGNDCRRYEGKVSGPTLVHVPHGVSPGFDSENKTCTIDALLTGATDENHYPLRCRFRRLIESGKIPGMVVSHPGYRVENPAAQRRVYSGLLARAKIALVSSSRHQYALAKYVEAALAGCLLVGDVPDDRQRQFKRFMVVVRPNDCDDVIAGRVRWWLQNDRARQIRADVGRRTMLDGYTADHYARRFLESARQFLAKRGVVR